MTTLEAWELASYVVTVIGLPFAIAVYLLDKRRERDNEDEAVYESLSNAYTDFLRLVLDNPDLKLRSSEECAHPTDEQRERMLVLFDILVSLFERAYVLLYEPDMKGGPLRRWRSWEDYMREWCRREDFRRLLPQLLTGEDPDFVAYLNGLVSEETAGHASARS